MSKQQLNGSQQETEAPAVESAQQNAGQNVAGTSNSEQQQKLEEAKYRANYTQALGDALGGRLYDAVADLISMDNMVRYGKDLVDSLLDAAVSAASDASEMNLTGDAQDKVVSGLETLLDPLVERMIRSEVGTQLVEKLQHGVGSNPYAVAGVGILAAAAAVLTDMDIPTLKPKLKLGGGFSANASLDLGSLRNIALGATKVGLSYKREDVRAAVAISRAKDGALGGEVSGQIGDNKQYLRGNIKLDEQGITAFEIGGALGLSENSNLSGKMTGTDPEKIPNWEVQVMTEKDDFVHTGNLRYDASSKDLFAKYTGKSEKLMYYANLSGNTQSESLNNFSTGFRYTPEKGDVYSSDYQYNFENQSHQLDMVAQKRMGDFSLRGHQRFQYDKNNGLDSNTELMAAYHMGTDLSLIGGADVKYSDNTGKTVMLPKAGIQYKDVPIVLQYDPQTRATSVGITLKF